MTDHATRPTIFSAGQNDARSIASTILLTSRQRLLAAELAFVRHVASGRPIDEPRAVARLLSIRDAASRRRAPRSAVAQRWAA